MSLTATIVKRAPNKEKLANSMNTKPCPNMKTRSAKRFVVRKANPFVVRVTIVAAEDLVSLGKSSPSSANGTVAKPIKQQKNTVRYLR